MRYFITGATGFLGGHIVRQLRAANHDVIALVRTPSKARDLADLGVTLAEGDVTDAASLRSPMAGVDGVFHVAGWYKIGVRDTRPAVAINVDGTRNMLEAMKALNIPRGVYVSTLGIFGDTKGELKDESYVYHGKHDLVYTETKWRAHHEVAAPMIAEGLPLIIVQPGVIYGPDDQSGMGQMFRMWLRGLVPLTPSVAAFCWAHVDDTARGIILAMQKGAPGQTYIIGGPAYTMPQVMAVASKVTGKPAPLIKAGPALMDMNAAIMSVLGAVVPLPEPFAAETMLYTARTTNLGTSAKAERDLGFSTRPLEDGLRETLTYEMHRMAARRA